MSAPALRSTFGPVLTPTRRPGLRAAIERALQLAAQILLRPRIARL
jgi:hypothetical protein